MTGDMISLLAALLEVMDLNSAVQKMEDARDGASGDILRAETHADYIQQSGRFLQIQD